MKPSHLAPFPNCGTLGNQSRLRMTRCRDILMQLSKGHFGQKWKDGKPFTRARTHPGSFLTGPDFYPQASAECCATALCPREPRTGCTITLESNQKWWMEILMQSDHTINFWVTFVPIFRQTAVLWCKKGVRNVCQTASDSVFGVHFDGEEMNQGPNEDACLFDQFVPGYMANSADLYAEVLHRLKISLIK